MYTYYKKKKKLKKQIGSFFCSKKEKFLLNVVTKYEIICKKKKTLLKYSWRAKTNTSNGHSRRGKFSKRANCDKL